MKLKVRCEIKSLSVLPVEEVIILTTCDLRQKNSLACEHNMLSWCICITKNSTGRQRTPEPSIFAICVKSRDTRENKRDIWIKDGF